MLEHSLRNTGAKPIETSVYEHNFYVIDGQPAGPDFTVKFPFAPRAVADLCNAALEGRWDEARRLHMQYFKISQTLFIESNPIPVKAALAMMGKIEYDLRLPLCKMSEANYEKLRKVMIGYGLIR